MPKSTIMLAAALLILSPLASAQSNAPDVRIGLSWDSPSDDDNWDKGGVGFDVQAVFWLPNKIGIAASLGRTSWDANDDVETVDAVSGALDGDADLTYIGVSAVHDWALQGQWSFRGEAGIRYVMVDSNVDIYYVNSSGSATEELDIDNGVTGVLAGDALLKVNENVTLFGGAGVQFDLVKGDASAFGDDNESSLGSVFIRAGAQFHF
jgi:hypothetical protein